MTVSIRMRVVCNLLLYIGLSYIVSLLIGSLTYSLIMHFNVLALHIFICEVNGDCRYMRIREYVGHILAIAGLTFSVEVALVQLFKHELSFLSICLLVALIKGGIVYELKYAKI